MKLQLNTYHWMIFILILWGGFLLTSELISMSPYGISEATAHALLLNWSVADKIISTVFTYGIPDLRALLFIPLAIYWSGSLIAATVYAMLLFYAACMLFYRWNEERNNHESALIATGLLLISPVAINEIDSIGTGLFLLLVFALGNWTNNTYRNVQRPLGGWFFCQLFLIGISVSLHPIGLAYPLALLWEWYYKPLDQRQQTHAYIGIGVMTIFILILQMGWELDTWPNNPIIILGQAISGFKTSNTALLWITGIIMSFIIMLIVFFEKKKLFDDLLTRILLFGLVIGIVISDGAWALIAMAFILYCGMPLIIRYNNRRQGSGFMARRGIVFVVVFLATMMSTQADKAHYMANVQNILSPHDQLILTLGAELEAKTEKPALIISQWPGQTMLALRQPVLPLPKKHFPNEANLLDNLKGVTHIVFDPFDPRNKTLGDQIARLGSTAKTLSLQEGGAIIAINSTQPETEPLKKLTQ